MLQAARRVCTRAANMAEVRGVHTTTNPPRRPPPLQPPARSIAGAAAAATHYCRPAPLPSRAAHHTSHHSMCADPAPVPGTLQQPPKNAPQKRVLVLGAGWAGISAARTLLAGAPAGAVAVTVLEATDQVGGRSRGAVVSISCCAGWIGAPAAACAHLNQKICSHPHLLHRINHPPPLQIAPLKPPTETAPPQRPRRARRHLVPRHLGQSRLRSGSPGGDRERPSPGLPARTASGGGGGGRPPRIVARTTDNSGGDGGSPGARWCHRRSSSSSGPAAAAAAHAAAAGPVGRRARAAGRGKARRRRGARGGRFGNERIWGGT
jgi:hypothetical protein